MKPFFVLVVVARATAWAGSCAAADPVDFARDVAPIFEKNCVRCHSAEKAKGKLSLSSREEFLRGGETGPVVSAGQPDDSRLLEIVSGEKPEMPAEGAPLTKQQVETLRAWIVSGAEWPAGRTLQARAPGGTDWWSFQPVRRAAAPHVRNTAWARNEIDHFVLAKLEAKGLEPSPEADRRTLIRRLSIDLIGLPPSPAEVAEFVADEQQLAYDRLVDRLLASPRYGERWAQHWLDVVRFSESDGFEEDQERPVAWPYRDYVIHAFNSDLPYDQFMRDQIAGDVLKPMTSAGIAATGMLVAGPWDAVQRVTPSKLGRLQSREEQLEEIVGAVSQTFLGLTVNCARCHDHKFDPIPQTDYYRLKAVFEGVDHGLTPQTHGVMRLMGDVDEEAWKVATQPLRDRIAAGEKSLAQLNKKMKEADGNEALTNATKPLRDAAYLSLAEPRKELADRFPVAMTFTGTREEPQPTVLYKRGDIKQPGQVVTPGGLSAVAAPAADWGLMENAPEATRRIQFAHWLTRPEHPLPARVMVNRVWQFHFGTGLVETASDFGHNGGHPTHPELLDWLADEFVRSGWSVKHLHRLILRSASYRQAAIAVDNSQSAAMHAKAAAIDAEARYLWRFPPRRLEGEVVRDSLLSFSGKLNHEMGGPSFKPYTVTRLNTFFYHLFDKDEPAFNRRSIYRMHLITGRSPFLDALDCPSPSVTTPRRRSTVTPLQALALMNDSFLVRQAEQFAQRIAAENDDPAAQVTVVFETVFSRPPRESERVACLEILQQHGLATVCWSLFNASEFLYVR